VKYRTGKSACLGKQSAAVNQSATTAAFRFLRLSFGEVVIRASKRGLSNGAKDLFFVASQSREIATRAAHHRRPNTKPAGASNALGPLDSA
jgi:hypothetical protein